MKLLEDFNFVDDPLETLDDEVSEALPIFGSVTAADHKPSTEFKKLTQDNLLNLQKLSFDFDKLAEEFQQTQQMWRNEKHKNQKYRNKFHYLQNQMRSLSEQKCAAADKYEKARQEVHQLQKDLATIREKFKILEIEKTQIQENHRKTTESEQQYRFQMDRFSKLVPDLQNQIEAVEGRYQESQKAYNELLNRYYAFQSEKIRVQEENKSLQTQIKGLKKAYSELETQKFEIQRQWNEVKVEVPQSTQPTQSQDNQMVASFVQKVEMDSLYKELQDLRTQSQIWESARQDWQRQKEKWQERAAEDERRIEKLKGERDRASQKIVDTQKSEDQQKVILTQQIQDLRHSKTRLQQRISDLESSQKKLVAEKKEQEDLRGLLSKRAQNIFELEDRLSVLQKQLETEKAQASAVEEKNEHLAWTRRNQKSELVKLQQENKSLNEKIIDLQTLSLQKEAEFQDIQIELKGSNAQWEARVRQLQADLDQSEAKRGEYLKEIQNQKEIIENHKIQSATQMKQITEAEENLVQLASTEKNIKGLEDKIAEREQALDLREQQFSHYVQLVNHAQEELRSAVSRLDQEMQLSINLNPLKDFIKITEREIDRIDLQLKKTPTISPERIRLETYMDELFEQRVFLKDNIRKINQEADKRRSQLAEIYKSTSLSAVPPMPPKVKKDR